jgi:hypothetical protein
VATEVVFRGLLSGLEPEEAVALLSALVFQVCWGRLMTRAAWAGCFRRCLAALSHSPLCCGFSRAPTSLAPPAEVAAAVRLSAQEKSEVVPQLPSRLSSARDDLAALVAECGLLQAAAGLPITVEEYLGEVLHMGLMEVRGWAMAQWREAT